MMYKNMDEKTVIAEAERLFAAADTDGSGEIDYSEWAIATINKRNVLSDEKLKGAFELFDKVTQSFNGTFRMAVEQFLLMK